MIRYSNAAALVANDLDDKGNHGSRGMAIKVYDVGEEVLLEDQGCKNQDFLMINQPMFAFANIEDYLALNQVLIQHNDSPLPFFADVPGILQKLANSPQDLTAAEKRKLRSAEILKIIQNTVDSEDANPLQMQYFGAAPFLFGDDKVMKFSAKPVLPETPTKFPENPGGNYLREALSNTMQQQANVVFKFLVQVQDYSEELEIENTSAHWDEAKYEFKQVAEILIESPQELTNCENLEFNPWHSLPEHRPIGGINRLRESVYITSAEERRG